MMVPTTKLGKMFSTSNHKDGFFFFYGYGNDKSEEEIVRVANSSFILFFNFLLKNVFEADNCINVT